MAGLRWQSEDLVAVRIEDAELCPRYTARVVRGVKIGPSPDWLRSTLEKVGIRSISNVVDVTNYVMLGIGQPLHAFDYHLDRQGPADRQDRRIVVRRAARGEKFITLDGQERTGSPPRMLLIADEEKGIALAGVMGGQNTEINDRTVDVLIESAYFNPTNIRRTSKVLGLRSESSYRFERGADIGISDWASRRAAQLILETAGGRTGGRRRGCVSPSPPSPSKSPCAITRSTNCSASNLRPEEMEYYLGQLGLKTAARKPAARRRRRRQPEPVTFRNPNLPRGPQTRGGFDRGSRPASWRGQNPRHTSARCHRRQRV